MWDEQIDLDVHRAMGQHSMFLHRYEGGQRSLFRVLRALALHFPDTGYAQGMASIIGTLLCYYEEDMAFVMAVRLWRYRGIEWLFGNDLNNLSEAIADLESKWIPTIDKTNQLLPKLQNLGLETKMWGMTWYITLFNYTLPFQAQLRVWDVFMLLGGQKQQQIAPALPLPEINAQLLGVDGLGKGAEGTTAQLPPKPNLEVLHAVAAALVLGMRERVMKGDLEAVFACLTRRVYLNGERGEDAIMGVARSLMKEMGWSGV